MAIHVSELREWLDSLASCRVAIGDDGLQLVEIDDDDSSETGAYLEVGGIPDLD